ncbi:MAG: hypothetical protein A2170_01060 [Deltaproteobacteria bacterium RBG_13_53_10]|nr:MAG: hypothetical protein A2170_01060 [Deltaproteobacteria bacterium RBG_13_53_10]
MTSNYLSSSVGKDPYRTEVDEDAKLTAPKSSCEKIGLLFFSAQQVGQKPFFLCLNFFTSPQGLPAGGSLRGVQTGGGNQASDVGSRSPREESVAQIKKRD